ncbi:SDR family NAD(P)-dependent oxidoreductase [Tenacibaculum caenipelagi]|uniref:Short subunit dehydrogenase n=1 Tax=Tenacibaculum caenipelagi TaxID=1325435 RepID=A0A4R6TF83_9FLAO|nr:SDR family NAD(P)-dependent oxidoreductase [Tenacibaculum caenipelagi]TDQ25722.1 short subunit dehydrogenase [Tenacibaculum caenipelagi]
MKLLNNKILITDATSGIGRELAERFCQLDNQIIAVGRNEIRLEELVKLDKRITSFKCDISSQSELDRLVGLTIVPKAKLAVYCGTKAAIHIFSKSLRYQLDKIKVFEIIPTLVAIEMTKGKGKGKISPQRLVDEFIKAYKNNRYEVNIHKVKLLRIINRISPKIAYRIMKGVTV